jgi:hypothetical protein
VGRTPHIRDHSLVSKQHPLSEVYFAMRTNAMPFFYSSPENNPKTLSVIIHQ